MSHLSKFILSALLSLAVAAPVAAAIGDNAPPIPAGWKTQHPRLPFPNNTFLGSLAANSGALASYNAIADQWNSKNPGGMWELRRLVIAYLANKTANPAKAATYLAKIKELADLGGTWGRLLYSVNDAVGNGTYTLTSPTANFLTGCEGNCAGAYLSINARLYVISSVPNANTVVLSQSNPAPSGTGLEVRIFSTYGVSDMNIALVYDWLYNDLDAGTRTKFLNQLEILCTIWEENYIGLNASPYNDVFYIRQGPSGLINAIVLYPDHPNSLKHMKFMTDVWFSVLLPVWKQVFGPEGGGWHENWTDYVRGNNGLGLTTFIVPSLLSWQAASGEPIFARESWLKNFAYFTMYMTRPDLLMTSIGDSSRAYLVGESRALGSLNGLAEIYNDPVLRGWSRFINTRSADAFEPSAWPYYTPDNPANPVSDRSPLPTTRNFTGWGLLSMRTGWGENDTYATLKYGDNFWSHEHFDTGSFTIFSRGLLALDSGSYRSGSNSKHQNQYARQTIAHNTLTVTDPADVYPTGFATAAEDGSWLDLAPPNDGGQRRVGTLYNQRFPQFVSPNNMGDWLRNWDYYHMGTMVGFANTPKYTYTAVDITNAYNNKYSATTPNASNRTYRVQKAVRHMLFIPRSTSAYVVVFDQVTSTNASFVKRWILHSVNQPKITGNKFEIVRDEVVSSLPYVDLWPYPFPSLLKNTVGTGPTQKYQFDGKLYGWMVQPQAGTITTVGGPGKEFWVENPLQPGTGTNWNQCMKGQCAANVEGLGPVEDFINPDPNTAPHEPGSWRIEVKPSVPATADHFLHVMLATTTGDTNVPASITVPAGLPAGSVGATWVDNGKTYTVVFPKDGVGGRITITGVVDEDLLLQAQQLPAQVQLVSGSGQSGNSGAPLAMPFTVVVNDAAGRPVANANVHWAITQGGGFVDTKLASTDAQGRSSAILIPNGAAGAVTKVMANVNGLAPVEFTATVAGAPPVTNSLQSLSCTPASIAAGAAATCIVTLTQAAAAGGVAVSLSSDNAIITTPSAVTVPAGSVSATFSATASAGAVAGTATLTAALAGATRTFSLSVGTAPPTNPITVSSLTCAPASLSSGATATCTVTLTQVPSVDVNVAFSSTISAITVPSSVLVHSGWESATFTAQAGSVTASQTGVITATVNGSSKTASLTISPLSVSVEVSGLSCTPTSVTAGETTTCTVTLSEAPDATVNVSLSSSVAVLTLPAAVSVSGGAASATFSATAGSFPTGTTAMLTASLGGSSKMQQIVLTAPTSGGTPIGTKNWVMVRTRGIPAQTVGFEKLVYAPAPVNKSVMLGNYHSLGTEPNQALVGYDFDTNSWSVLDVGASFRTEHMPEAGHPVGGFAYNPNSKSFLYYCCASGSNQPENVYGMWWFDAVGQTGRSKQTATRPGAVQYHSSTFDIANNLYVLHGGGSLVGTWTYDPVTNVFRQQTPAGTPPNASVNWPSMTYNTDDGKVYLFGGETAGAYSNDLFVYDAPANTWTKLNPAGARPSPRWRSGFAYDSVNKVFMLYGGENGQQVYNDTWIYNVAANTWTQLTTATVPPKDSVGPFETLAFDSDHNAFVLVLRGTGGYADGPSGTSAAQTWVFRYAGSGPDPGNTVASVDVPSGSLNRNSDGWAKEPSLASSGSTAYAAWVETGKPFDVTTNDSWFHVMVKQRNGNSQWTQLGTGALALDSEFNGYSESHSPSLAIIGGTPWVSWYKWNNSGNLMWSLWAKSWNGSSWQGGLVGRVGSDPARSFSGRSQLADVGGVPHVAFLEVDKTFYPQKTFVYVKFWDGTNWILKGSGALNINQSAITTATSVAIASDGSNPYVAWTEYTIDGSMKNPAPPQVYVARWTGTQWAPVGSGSLNMSTTRRAEDVSLAFAGGKPYVAWTERSDAGNAQVFVKTFNGSTWAAAGNGSLNRNTQTGWAFRPSLVDGGSGILYLGWVEQAALGVPAQAHVSKWQAGAWTPLGDSLNVEGSLASAQRITLAVVDGQPVAGWGELKAGWLRQVFTAQWDGSKWLQTAASVPSEPVSACDVNGDRTVNTVDVQAAVNQVLGMVPCSKADVQKNGSCNIVDVQRVITAVTSGTCLTGP